MNTWDDLTAEERLVARYDNHCANAFGDSFNSEHNHRIRAAWTLMIGNSDRDVNNSLDIVARTFRELLAERKGQQQ